MSVKLVFKKRYSTLRTSSRTLRLAARFSLTDLASLRTLDAGSQQPNQDDVKLPTDYTWRTTSPHFLLHRSKALCGDTRLELALERASHGALQLKGEQVPSDRLVLLISWSYLLIGNQMITRSRCLGKDVSLGVREAPRGQEPPPVRGLLFGCSLTGENERRARCGERREVREQRSELAKVD
eukprot:scaffold31296_cov27-Tisochrysis_lutea.AAC.2